VADAVRLQVAGPPESARGVLEQALTAQGFRFTWQDDGRAVVEKGSRGKAMFLGAFALHYKYVAEIAPQPDGSVGVGLTLATTGMSGGAIGYAKVRSKLDELRGVLTQAYQSGGSLIQAG
jgi:hypothetical protein